MSREKQVRSTTTKDSTGTISYSSMTSSLLICDSRGKGLEFYINQECTQRNIRTHFTVITAPGATITTAVNSANRYLHSRSFDFIYLMTGVNNLTSKSSNGKVTPVFTEIPNMVDVVTDYLTWAKSYLKQYSKYVIICQFVGLDINVYNLHRGHMTDFDAAQTIINDGVITLNQVVTMLNRDDHLTAPWIMDTIHSLTNGRRINKYSRFYDGLHPNETTQKLWSTLITKAAKTNINLHPH